MMTGLYGIIGLMLFGIWQGVMFEMAVDSE